jgi:hypothetical protein
VVVGRQGAASLQVPILVFYFLCNGLFTRTVFFVSLRVARHEASPIGKNMSMSRDVARCRTIALSFFVKIPLKKQPAHTPAGFDLTTHNSAGGDDPTRPPHYIGLFPFLYKKVTTTYIGEI